MRSCKICLGTEDVRSDGICRCCYDRRQADLRGMTYGKYISKFGHNLGRPVYVAAAPAKICITCGAPLPPRHSKFCSARCNKIFWQRQRRERIQA